MNVANVNDSVQASCWLAESDTTRIAHAREDEKEVKDPELECLSNQIEDLRTRLTVAIQASEGDLHAPIVQALSRKIDAMIVEFTRSRAGGAAARACHTCIAPRANQTEPGQDPASRRRRSGIAAVGNVPWGTHLCQFYRTKDDLFSTLVPYFATGLEDHELCVWIVSAPVSVEDVMDVMGRSVRALFAYLDSGQFQVIRDADWYFAREPFDGRSIADACLAKLDDALRRGYEGMRLAAHPWGQAKARGEWAKFLEYEGYVDSRFDGLQIMALCGYPLDECGPRETADAVRSHDIILLEHDGQWQAI